MIYCDNAATTQMDERVRAAMDEWNNYANASSIYKAGIEARKKIDDARAVVADWINCEPEQVIFTSGGSESNAMVVRGYAPLYYGHLRPTSVAYSAVEHESVIENARLSALAQNARPAVEIPVSRNGNVEFDVLKRTLENNRHIGLVSIMAVNNELGSVNNIKELAFVSHCFDASFHTDCVQAVNTVQIDVKKFGCDFLSLSAHKFHGPKGIGVLFCKDKSSLVPLVKGSNSQEFGMRGGTENVTGIIGLGVAAQISKEECLEEKKKVTAAKSAFYFRFMQEIEQCGIKGRVHFNGSPSVPVGKIFSITIDGIDAQTMVLALAAKNICISAGSACNSSSTESSHVLKAIGLTDVHAHNTIRVSFSKYTTEYDAVATADAIAHTAAGICMKMRKDEWMSEGTIWKYS